MLQGYFLGTRGEGGCQKVSISISGKKPFSFADFCQNHRAQPLHHMSSDQLLRIYQEYEKFGLHSPIKALLENGNSTEAYQQIDARYKQLQEFQKVYKLEVYNVGGEEACNVAAEKIDRAYGILEDAIYRVINNPLENSCYEDWEYHAYIQHHNIEDPYQVTQTKLAILLFLYTQQQNIDIDRESLKTLYEEIIFLDHLPKGSQWKISAASFFDTIKQNTGIEISEASAEILYNSIILPNTDSGTLGQSLDIASIEQ